MFAIPKCTQPLYTFKPLESEPRTSFERASRWGAERRKFTGDSRSAIAARTIWVPSRRSTPRRRPWADPQPCS